eukprot:3642062-Alexandrium_andersonii.AAC.1
MAGQKRQHPVVTISLAVPCAQVLDSTMPAGRCQLPSSQCCQKRFNSDSIVSQAIFRPFAPHFSCPEHATLSTEMFHAII